MTRPAHADYTWTPLDVPGSLQTAANGINNAGQIVGTYCAARGFHGFLLSDGKYTTIDVPGATETLALGINAAGQIVGLYFEAGGVRTHGFLATPK
jgi:probable HAF family extracellular repeat protein